MATNLGPKFYSELALQFTKKVIEEIHGVGVPVVLHICGETKPIWDYMTETGSDALSLGHEIDMAEAKERVGDKVALAGNISPVDVLMLGTPDDVEKAVKECLQNGVNDVCPGCEFVLRIPLKNMKTRYMYANPACARREN